MCVGKRGIVYLLTLFDRDKQLGLYVPPPLIWFLPPPSLSFPSSHFPNLNSLWPGQIIWVLSSTLPPIIHYCNPPPPLFVLSILPHSPLPSLVPNLSLTRNREGGRKERKRYGRESGREERKRERESKIGEKLLSHCLVQIIFRIEEL